MSQRGLLQFRYTSGVHPNLWVATGSCNFPMFRCVSGDSPTTQTRREGTFVQCLPSPCGGSRSRDARGVPRIRVRHPAPVRGHTSSLTYNNGQTARFRLHWQRALPRSRPGPPSTPSDHRRKARRMAEITRMDKIYARRTQNGLNLQSGKNPTRRTNAPMAVRHSKCRVFLSKNHRRAFGQFPLRI